MTVGAFYLEVIINTFAADDKRPALIASPFRNSAHISALFEFHASTRELFLSVVSKCHRNRRIKSAFATMASSTRVKISK